MTERMQLNTPIFLSGAVVPAYFAGGA